MTLFTITFAVLFIVTLLCIGFGQSVLASHQKKQVKMMLRRAAAQTGKRRLDLVWDENTSSGMKAALDRIAILEPLRKRIAQSNLPLTLEKFLLQSGVAFLGSLIIAQFVPILSRRTGLGIALAVACGMLPFLRVSRARRKRFDQFEEQFPGALDFLSRAMRAGHAFSIGLEMLVADAPEPLASTFRRVLQGLQLGSPMEAALAELIDTMPLIDVRFFVTAVLLQQGTGGNLGEILDSMSSVIRDRFRLKGAVKAAAAHGKITSAVLAGMPVVVTGILMIISPAYLRPLVEDPVGKNLAIAAVVGQVVGYLCIRKIVAIKV